MADEIFEQIATPESDVIPNFLDDLKSIPDKIDIVELFFHPGYISDELMKLSTLNTDRERDVRVLLDKNFRKEIEKMGFEIVDCSKLD